MLTFCLGVLSGIVVSVLTLVALAVAVCIQQTKIERDRGE